MQTFLPYANFLESAAVLDNKRLWKQCVEAKQLLLGQFPNHPAARMWRGYHAALAQYGTVMCDQALSRNIMALNVKEFFDDHLENSTMSYPPWIGNEDFHASHRSNLLRKDWDYYSRFGWTEPSNLPYVWPI